MVETDNLTWSKQEAVDAFEALALRLGLPVGAIDNGLAGPSNQSIDAMRWMADSAGLELQSVTTTRNGIRRDLRTLAPAIVMQPKSDELLILLRGTRRHVICIDRAGEERRVRWSDLVDWICAPLQEQLNQQLEPLLSNVRGMGARRKERIAGALAGGEPFILGWILREQAVADRNASIVNWKRLGATVGLLTAGHAIQFALFIAAWALLGRAALAGEPAGSWLVLWGLLFATVLTFRTLLFWQQGTTALRIGLSLKRGLLRAGLAQQPEALRRLGSGNLLARALESDAFEGLAVNGGIAVILAAVELIIAATAVLGIFGAGSFFWLLVGFAVLVLALTWRYGQRRMRWTRARLRVSDQLVEQLLGYDTRVVQQSPQYWHAGEDRTLEDYHQKSCEMDAVAPWLRALPKLWLIAGFVVLIGVEFHTGWPVWMLAAGVGLALLVQQSLGQLVGGSGQLTQAFVLWRSLQPILKNVQSGTKGRYRPNPSDRATLMARELCYAYAGQDRVLDDLSLQISTGERMLITGQSGAGKSTLAKLLAGQLVPDNGQLLLNGLDINTLGDEEWRRQIVLVPQFHHNQIFPDTLAFNLLLGRRWPPSRQDLALAQEVCMELGLGDLIERMPGGLSQIVGEGGWPLSHGEAARVHIARCILQEPQFAILDESLGPLDPRSFARVMESLRQRIPSLILIAHA